MHANHLFSTELFLLQFLNLSQYLALPDSPADPLSPLFPEEGSFLPRFC